MWGELWRIDALVESGRLAAAAEELARLRVAVERVGGPVSAWHLDRVTACIAQAQGRYADAAAIGRRGFDRMRPVEPAPATGAYFALQMRPRRPRRRHRRRGDVRAAAVRATAAVRDDGCGCRACASCCSGRAPRRGGRVVPAGRPDRDLVAARVLRAAGVRVRRPRLLPSLGRYDDLAVLLDRLEPFRGEHAVGDGVAYMGPVELALGRGAAALGRLDAAVDDLADGGRAGRTGRSRRVRRRGAATTSRWRCSPATGPATATGPRPPRATPTAWPTRSAWRRTSTAPPRSSRGSSGDDDATALSPREAEVAGLVAEGLTNRQIAERLVISERTAQNHVQHILTKLGFTTRSQIAAWSVRTEQMSRPMSDPADAGIGAPIRSVPPAADPGRTDKEDSHAVDHRRHPAVRVDRAVRQGARPAGRDARRPRGALRRHRRRRRLRVVTLWESKAHADRFFAETLGPALAKALGPEPVGAPEIIGIDVARSYVRQPVA